MTTDARALTAGVGEAPRHEIASGGAPAVQRALWGFGCGGDRYAGELGEEDWAEPTSGRAIEDGWTRGKGVEPSPGGWYAPRVGRNKARGTVAGR